MLLYFLFVFLKVVCSVVIFEQDNATRYWLTPIDNSIPPPPNWEVLVFKSVSQIIAIFGEQSNNNSPLWFVDTLSKSIYSSNDTINWSESLHTVSMLYKNNTNRILDTNCYLLKFNIENKLNDTLFYITIANKQMIQLWSCSSIVSCQILEEIETLWNVVTDGVVISNNIGYLGSDIGLFEINIKNNKLEIYNIFEFDSLYITSLAYSDKLQIMAIGTITKLYRWNFVTNNSSSPYSFDWIEGVVDGPPSSMVFSNDNILYSGNYACINALLYSNNSERMELWYRIGKHEGLPFRNISHLIMGWNNEIWMSHLNGAMSRFIPSSRNEVSVDGEFYYYRGNRWMTGSNVTSLYSNKYYKILFAATEVGLTVFNSNQISLEDKANYFINNIEYPRHDRYGLTADCSLSTYGSLSTWSYEPNDNDGLWTSIYLSGLSFKYFLTKDINTYNLCFHHLSAFNRLHNMTNGINGLVARSFAKISDGTYGGKWFNSTTNPGWQWKGDTSSDEIVGHFMVYSIFYDLVCENDNDRLKLLNYMQSILNYILSNDYKLIDADGSPTTWGFWDPQSLNDNQDYFDERGLNSLQILTWIMATYHYTYLYNNGNDNNNLTQLYLSQWNYLGINNNYFNNLLNQKITIPNDINHSDDELAGLTYLLYFWIKYQRKYILNINDSIWDNYFETKFIYFDLSWNRTFNFINTKYESLYSLIEYLANYDINKNNINNNLINKIINDLKRWPLEWIPWPTINNDRIDLIADSTMGRSCLSNNNIPLCSRQSLPKDERDGTRWNSDPYIFNSGSGNSETDVGSYTIVYWMSKYFNIV